MFTFSDVTMVASVKIDMKLQKFRRSNFSVFLNISDVATAQTPSSPPETTRRLEGRPVLYKVPTGAHMYLTSEKSIYCMSKCWKISYTLNIKTLKRQRISRGPKIVVFIECYQPSSVRC
jgi:hypothetical protein